jgi:hypothetical protein
VAEISIEGQAELYEKFGVLEGNRILSAPMQRAVLSLQARLARYPSAIASSRYVRTGMLGRKWTSKVEQDGSGITGTVGNDAAGPRGQLYGIFVQGPRQAGVHRGRWETADEVAEAERGAIVDDFEREIERALR